MIRSKEATGKTVEEARAAACAALGVSEDDLNVSYEILEMPQSTGLIFKKKTPAKVRVTVEEEDAAPEGAGVLRNVRGEVGDLLARHAPAFAFHDVDVVFGAGCDVKLLPVVFVLPELHVCALLHVKETVAPLQFGEGEDFQPDTAEEATRGLFAVGFNHGLDAGAAGVSRLGVPSIFGQIAVEVIERGEKSYLAFGRQSTNLESLKERDLRMDGQAAMVRAKAMVWAEQVLSPGSNSASE